MSEDLPSSGRLQEASGAEISRRLFLSTAGTAGIVAAIGSREPAPAADVSPETSQMEGTIPVTLRINGQERRLRVDPRTTLLDCLRETLELTGTKKGCDHGQCGACTVHVNSRRVNS